jgi:hypothetical protein
MSGERAGCGGSDHDPTCVPPTIWRVGRGRDVRRGWGNGRPGKRLFLFGLVSVAVQLLLLPQSSRWSCLSRVVLGLDQQALRAGSARCREVKCPFVCSCRRTDQLRPSMVFLDLACLKLTRNRHSDSQGSSGSGCGLASPALHLPSSIVTLDNSWLVLWIRYGHHTPIRALRLPLTSVLQDADGGSLPSESCADIPSTPKTEVRGPEICDGIVKGSGH